MSEKNLWMVFVALAGLSWGTYVPLIFYGGSELGGKPLSRMIAILCVGVAYFLIGVVVPLYFLFSTDRAQWPTLNVTGLLFSGLAGVAGAVGALCVIFASKAAMETGLAIKKEYPDFNPATYRMYIAPLIFALAPIINTIVSLLWHPKAGAPFHFGLEKLPDYKLVVGIVLVGLGSFLVLLSKEQSEATAAKPQPKAVAPPDLKPAPGGGEGVGS